MAYELTNEERETTINWSIANRTASIDTADPTVIRKLDKLTQEHPETYKCVKVDEPFKTKMYEVSSRYIRFGKPPTEAQREANRRNGKQFASRTTNTSSLASSTDADE